MSQQLPRTINSFLKPGELVFTKRPTVVTTILGSCVAITLFYPRLALGSICHAVMPDSRGEKDLRFVDRALAFMLTKFDRRDIPPSDLEAKLFGGADMFRREEQAQAGAGRLQMGSQNVDAALKALAAAGIRLSSSDVGGTMARKLLFYTHTGEVLLKKFRLTEGVEVCRD